MLSPFPLAAMATKLRSGQADLSAYIQEVCDYIGATEPLLQALLPESNRRARLLAEAVALTARFPEPEQRPPLYGILLGVKDIFHVTEFETHAGSLLPPSLFEGPEASCVTKLRQAGALILGKTVTTEFAFFEPGPTHNPHNLKHTPGGSSSGSAAAVAAGYCQLALGTQTIGSIIRPAAFCGVIGFKPSYGRVASDGVIPCASSVDTVGFFTQDVAGIALTASLLCENWRHISGPAREGHLPVLGVPDGPYLAQITAEGLQAFAAQLACLEKAGYAIRHVPVMDNIEAINERHYMLVGAEMAQVHASWFADYQSLYRPQTVAMIQRGQSVPASALEIARRSRSELRATLEAAMQQHGIDAWVCPAALGPAPEGLASTGSPLPHLPWTHAGLPAITLPAGYATNRLPLGLQVVAPFMADESLLAYAEGIADVVRDAVRSPAVEYFECDV
jgi:Asp-tRNA(Asn)/Glu-tRNA(Gln) amidotransferase A subunit family amidase